MAGIRFQLASHDVVRVILSRKGFDSQYGRVPSPMLADGRMISLPIPDKDAPVAYGAIRRDEIPFGSLVSDLTRGKTPPRYLAHLDPDLDKDAVPRQPGWRPGFGQAGAALGHLRKQGVMPGDLFLFFGWFRPAEVAGGRWRYVAGSRAVHAIWGWMSIAAIYSCDALPLDVLRWGAGHPHLERAHPHPNDGIFVAADEMHIDGRRLPGAGLFAANPTRVLTAPGAPRSRWQLPSWMHPHAGLATLSYHEDRERWTTVDDRSCGLLSAPIGQEFVLTTDRQDILATWLGGVFADVQS